MPNGSSKIIWNKLIAKNIGCSSNISVKASHTSEFTLNIIANHIFSDFFEIRFSFTHRLEKTYSLSKLNLSLTNNDLAHNIECKSGLCAINFPSLQIKTVCHKTKIFANDYKIRHNRDEHISSNWNQIPFDFFDLSKFPRLVATGFQCIQCITAVLEKALIKTFY